MVRVLFDKRIGFLIETVILMPRSHLSIATTEASTRLQQSWMKMKPTSYRVHVFLELLFLSLFLSSSACVSLLVFGNATMKSSDSHVIFINFENI